MNAARAETASSPGGASVAAERSLTGGRQNSSGRKRADCMQTPHPSLFSLFPVRVRVLEGGGGSI